MSSSPPEADKYRESSNKYQEEIATRSPPKAPERNLPKQGFSSFPTYLAHKQISGKGLFYVYMISDGKIHKKITIPLYLRMANLVPCLPCVLSCRSFSEAGSLKGEAGNLLYEP
jgi:hypothetical protein